MARPGSARDEGRWKRGSTVCQVKSRNGAATVRGRGAADEGGVLVGVQADGGPLMERGGAERLFAWPRGSTGIGFGLEWERW
jgi:hypothetical protein